LALAIFTIGNGSRKKEVERKQVGRGAFGKSFKIK
jgi:hypothetical protein